MWVAVLRPRSVKNALASLGIGAIALVAPFWGCGRNGAPAVVVGDLPASARPTAVAPAIDPHLAAVREALGQQHFLQAFDLCHDAKAQGVPLPLTLEMRAEVYKATEYLDREIDTLRSWTQAAPHDPAPWYKLFYIYRDLGWIREAQQASKKCLELAPNDARSFVTRAVLAERSRQPETALPDIQEAVRLDPQNTALLHLWATALLRVNDFSGAENKIREALAREPDNVRYRILLARALLGENKTPEGLLVLQKIQKDAPDNQEVAFLLGSQALDRGDTAEARGQFERVARDDAEYGNALWQLGRIYIQEGRTDEGKKLQKMYRQMDENETTFEAVQEQLEKRPDDADIHYRLGRMHQEAGELPQAIAELRRTLTLKPNSPQIREALAAALDEFGRKAEANYLRNRKSFPPETT